MWLRPRATIQHVIDTAPSRWVIVIAMISGISSALDRAALRESGDVFSVATIFGLAIVLGPIGGIIQLYLFGGLLRWTGSWIQGEAEYEEIRAAIAWSSIPIVWSIWLWVPSVLIFGEELFTSETPMLDADPFLAVQLIAFGFVEFAIGIWAFVIFLLALAQVQRFSVTRALINVIMAVLIIFLPLFLIFGSISLAT